MLGFRPYWCPSPFPSPSISRCFPFALIGHWISIVFLLYGRRIATHSVDPSLTHLLGEFPGLGWLWCPMLWSQRRNSGAHGAENLIQISALAVVEPRTLAPGLPRPPPFSRLLRHAGGYSRRILTPNLPPIFITKKFFLRANVGGFNPQNPIGYASDLL